MKKILILTVTAGNGHNACAKGMKEKLESFPDTEVKVVDLIKSFSTPRAFWTVDSGYSLAVGHFLPLYNAFYEHYKKAKPENRFKCMAQKTALPCTEGLLKEIYTYQPDVIYCTHFYAGIALTDLRLKYNLPCKVFISNLDYVNSPFWEGCIGVDYFAIPNEDFIEECIEEGFKPEQLLPMGLPVNEKFYFETDRKQAKRELGLDENTFTVLSMFGGGHWGGGLKIFEALTTAVTDRPIQIIMINGRNKKSYEKIEKMTFPENVKVINVGFTDKMPTYMAAADLAINKLGGTSATEILNKQIPILVTTHLAAQERHNLNYLTEKGVVLPFKNKKQLQQQLLRLINDQELYNKMVANIAPLRRNGIDNLARFMIEQENADYSQIDESKVDYSNIKKEMKQATKQAHKQTKQQAKKQ